MEYKILSVRQNQDSLITEVEFYIGEATVSVSIPHFRPQSVEEVLSGIQNRGHSEEAKIAAVASASTVLGNIAIGQRVSID